jgi:hypothetical protein
MPQRFSSPEDFMPSKNPIYDQIQRILRNATHANVDEKVEQVRALFVPKQAIVTPPPTEETPTRSEKRSRNRLERSAPDRSED